MKILPVEVPADRIAAYCEKWKIRELALFGSVLRDDFGPDSDIDVLVTFDGEATWSLWDVIQAELELQEIFGRPVDLVQRHSVEQSENWIRRRSILNTARTVYGG